MLDFCRATFDDPVREAANDSVPNLGVPGGALRNRRGVVELNTIPMDTSGDESRRPSPTVEVSRPIEGLVGSEVLTDTRKTNSTGPVHKMCSWSRLQS